MKNVPLGLDEDEQGDKVFDAEMYSRPLTSPRSKDDDVEEEDVDEDADGSESDHEEGTDDEVKGEDQTPQLY